MFVKILVNAIIIYFADISQDILGFQYFSILRHAPTYTPKCIPLQHISLHTPTIHIPDTLSSLINEMTFLRNKSHKKKTLGQYWISIKYLISADIFPWPVLDYKK